MNNSPELNKEDILARSRQSKKDEGVEHATIKGFRLGELLGSIVAMALIATAFFIGHFETVFAIGAIIFAHVLGQSLTVYLFKRTKYLLAWVILGIVGTIYFSFLFLAAMLEWIAVLDILWRFG
ncbi:MAG: DUF6442 family protein [Defluviitaleaceae bacterium]|nr:DUF6442 family protein [Defluviitaleaceae bacterium]